MRRWKKAALSAGLLTVGLALLLAGGAAFVLPGVAVNRIVQRVEAATGRKLAVGGASVNPFTWTFELRDVRFSERGRLETFAAFSRARIQVSPYSLLRWAPVIAEARFTSPYLRIVRIGANAYNFTDLLKWLPLHPRLSVSNLAVTEGSVDFIDQALPVEKRHELRSIALVVPFISSMALFSERYIAPRFSALVNGSPCRVEGRFRPLRRPVEASFNLDWKDVVLPCYVAYLPGGLPVRVESGKVSAKVAVSYRAAQKDHPKLDLSGGVTLAGVKLADRTGAPFLNLTRLEAEITDARLLAREFDLASLSADGLEIFLSRDKRGTWSHSRLARGASAGAGPRGRVLVTVAVARLRNGRFHFVDRLPPGGYAADLEGVGLDMQGYSTWPGKRASYSLSFTTARGEEGSLKGTFSPAPPATSSSVELSGLCLEAYYPYLAPVLRDKVKGTLDLDAHVDFGGPDGTRLEKVAVEGRRLCAPFGDGEGLTLASLSLDGGRFTPSGNLLEIAAVRLEGGALRFSRDSTGTFSPMNLFRRGKRGASREKAEKAPLRYRIGRVSGARLNVAFTDGLRERRPSFTIKEIAFTMEEFAGPTFGAIPFTAAAAYGEAGSVRASGRITPRPWNLDGDVAVQRIPLADFGAYLPANRNLVVADGDVDARLTVSLAAGMDQPTGTFGGSVGVRSLSCLGSDGKRLLDTETLRLERVNGRLAPFTVSIGDVVLSRFSTRIAVDEEGRLNLRNLYREEPKASRDETAPRGNEGTIRIGAVTLENGTLDFVDRHVAGGFTTTLSRLGGRVLGLSTPENRLAAVDLRGNLEERSPLRITGRVIPLRGDLFADLNVSVTDIALSPITHYAETYLGYPVERGQMLLALQYRIEDGRLDSENKVIIDHLTLGRHVDGDHATHLPVRLAVALLRDGKGEIHLDLPVTGRTDDPQFRFWREVLQSFKNVLIKAATSPFDLLKSLFAGKGDPASVDFAYGSAELSADERQELLKLAATLEDRPELKVGVVGFADGERDREAYRMGLLLAKMRAERFLPEAPFPKPREALEGPQGLPDGKPRERHPANPLVVDPEQRSLAEARARAVSAFLAEQGKVDPARILLKRAEACRAAAKEGGCGSRVELELAAE